MKRSLVLLLTLLLTGVAASQAAVAAPKPPTQWRVAATVKPAANTDSILAAVACPSNDWCMAVGSISPIPTRQPTTPIAEVRSGAKWRLVSVPVPAGAGFARLTGVSCLSTKSCFAVGEYSSGGGDFHPLIERWGGAGWSLMATGAPADQTLTLDLIKCTSATSCVAVGTSAVAGPQGPTSTQYFPYSARWDGSRWRSIPIYGVDGMALTSLSCASASTCFAVGYAFENGNYLPLAERYANGQWLRIQLPVPSGHPIALFTAVSCATAKSCLAVGQLGAVGDSRGVFAAGWNGQSWRLVTPPPSVGAGVSFTALSCRTATSCVGVGPTVAEETGAPAYSQRLANGVWTRLPFPLPTGSPGANPVAISCRPSGPCVAVGSFAKPTGFAAGLAEVLQ